MIVTSPTTNFCHCPPRRQLTHEAAVDCLKRSKKLKLVVRSLGRVPDQLTKREAFTWVSPLKPDEAAVGPTNPAADDLQELRRVNFEVGRGRGRQMREGLSRKGKEKEKREKKDQNETKRPETTGNERKRRRMQSEKTKKEKARQKSISSLIFIAFSHHYYCHFCFR